MAGGGETHSDITRFSKASPVHYFVLDMTSYLFYDNYVNAKEAL